MLRILPQSVPPPPGAGLTKLADPRRVLMGWLLFLAIIAVVIAVGWPFGVGTKVRRLQRDFLASGYLRSAQHDARAVPVRRAEALAALNRAVHLAPDHAVITQAAAQLYVELRAYREAAQWLGSRPRPTTGFAPGRVPEPQDVLTRVTLAQALIMTGRTAEGENMLQQLQQEVEAARQRGLMPDPLYALVLNNIAYVNSLVKRNLSEALQMANVAVQLQPAQPAFVDSLGWVEYQLGKYSEAAFHLEQAVRLYLPAESAEMYYHLGSAYARLGKKPDARWALRRALELDPSYIEAEDELRTLNQDLPRPSVA